MNSSTFNETDLELRKRLCNTLTLLGAKPEIVQILRNSLDRIVTDDEIQRIRNYNCELTEEHNRILTSLSTFAVSVSRT